MIAVAQACGEHAGELALGASQTIAQYLLPNMIASFVKSNPRVHVTAKSGNSDEMLEALVRGEVHLALIEGPEQRKDVHVEPFMEDHLVLVLPAGHEWADHTVGTEELKSAPLLVREFGSGSRRVIEQALASAGLKIKDLNVRMEIDSTEGLLSAVEAGLGVTFVSRWAVRNQLALETLRTARVQGLKLSRRFSLVYRSGPEPTGPVGAFRSLLLSHAASLAPRSTGKPFRQRQQERSIPGKHCPRGACNCPSDACTGTRRGSPFQGTKG